ncbi:MAG: ABC transporter ATP-binding protein [Simkaniaceae bacterium]|nr:MAG: ABC transporter ATP-binding protein [Simkaniaceae bacterium]
MKKLLEVKNLHTSFSTLSKKVRAVQGVSFDLKEGETLGIVGESGCGKSVMAKSITRLLPSISSRIDQGEIYYKGENLVLKRERELRKVRGKEIGMIFQDPMTSLNPTMRIGDQIIEGYALHHPSASKAEMKIRAIKLLNRVGVSDSETRLTQFPHELSGGMRQRVMIAIAMISSPKILIADEPTTALDVTIQAQILGLLKEIQKREQMSILLITHDFSIVAGFCDRVLVMYAGKIVESASVDELFRAPKHPYTRRLLNSIPRLDLSPTRQLYSIHGSPPDLSSKIKGCAFAERCPHAMKLCRDGCPSSIEVSKDHHTACWLFDPRIQRKEA